MLFRIDRAISGLLRGISDVSPQGLQDLQRRDTNGASAGQSEPRLSSEEDERNERIAQAMKLLFAARDRTLTLTEQRVNMPIWTDPGTHR